MTTPACGELAGIRDLQLIQDAGTVEGTDATDSDPTWNDASGREGPSPVPGIDGAIPDGNEVEGPDAAGVDATVPLDANGADATAPLDATNAPETSSPPACDGGLLPCKGVCVDPRSDPNNCNGCGNVCGTGACGTSIVADMSSAPVGWTFNGIATYDAVAASAVLTPATLSSAGTAIFAHPVTLDEFTAQFDFRMGFGGGTRCDGMGFMFEQTGPNALGANGSGLGMLDLAGFGVEFDIFDNGLCGDFNDDHVAIDSLAFCNSQLNNPLPETLAASGDLTSQVDLGDAQWHHAVATLQSGQMSVKIDSVQAIAGAAVPGLQVGSPYYFGFAGGTGALVGPDGSGGFRTEVRRVSIVFPTPRCL